MTALLQTKGKAPGVYIQEITVPGPIAGVSTNIAAFVGPAETGPLNKPTTITSFDQFSAIFGGYIEDPYRVYATHAVHGFFAEGGTNCYFVRVGTGAQAWLNLLDRSTKNRTTLVARALAEGTAGNAITVKVEDASVANTTVARPSVSVAANGAPAGGKTVQTGNAADAASFRPGDTVLLSKAATTERATIASIAKDTVANTTTFTLVASLTNEYGGGTIGIADLIPGQTKLRVAAAAGIEPGSYVAIAKGAITEDAVVKSVDQINGVLILDQPLAKTYVLDANVSITTKEFTLTVVGAVGATPEVFANLSLDPRHSRYFAKLVASASVSLDLADPPTVTPPTANLPVALAATALAGGADENLAGLTPAHYQTGIDLLRKLSDVNLLCVPDGVTRAGTSHFAIADTQAIQAAMIAHCERMQDRFAILDGSEMLPSDPTFDEILAQRQNLNSDGGYAALYFPWIAITNPLGSGRIFVPPSGHAAGVFARTDNTQGVFKAPANESISSALAVQVPLNDEEQGPLNDQGINVIRSFKSEGIKIWGARTIAPPSVLAWRFVNVRRLLLFIESSIQQGTRFAVFEPNNLSLWQQVKRMVNDFLTEQWTAGALFGATPEQAFRVRVDETLNPPSTRAQGILVVEVTVVPTTPAEFIIFQVVQDITGTTLKEATA